MKTPKFAVGQVVKVVACGWGCGPDYVGMTATVKQAINGSTYPVYQVVFENGTLSDISIWEPAFEAVEDDRTPAQQMGITVGTLVRLTVNRGGRWAIGTTARLFSDDESTCPLFEHTATLDTRFLNLDEVEVVPEVPAVTPLAPPVPHGYTALQNMAVNTFQMMYDAAVAYRNGDSTRLNHQYGICDNIERFANAVSANVRQMSEVKENLIRTTASYSGDYSYPVKGVEGLNPSDAFCRYSDKWGGEYGANRLQQLGEVIELIKTNWSDDLVNRLTPAKRNGLQVGDMVRYTGSGRHNSSIWVLRYDDQSSSPSFHRLGEPDNYNDLDLSHVVKVDSSLTGEHTVGEFLSTIAEKVEAKSALEKQIEDLQKQLASLTGDIALLDAGLAQQHKVKRI